MALCCEKSLLALIASIYSKISVQRACQSVLVFSSARWISKVCNNLKSKYLKNNLTLGTGNWSSTLPLGCLQNLPFAFPSLHQPPRHGGVTPREAQGEPELRPYRTNRNTKHIKYIFIHRADHLWKSWRATDQKLSPAGLALSSPWVPPRPQTLPLAARSAALLAEEQHP